MAWRVAEGMRRIGALLLGAWCAALLGACGGAVGIPVTPAPTPSATPGTGCTPDAGLPRADVVVDVTRDDLSRPVAIRSGQTLRVQSEQGCHGAEWDVVALVVDGSSAGVDRTGSGGVHTGVLGTVWATYVAHGTGPVRLEVSGGAFCPPLLICPLYRRMAVITVVVQG